MILYPNGIEARIGDNLVTIGDIHEAELPTDRQLTEVFFEDWDTEVHVGIIHDSRPLFQSVTLDSRRNYVIKGMGRLQ
jgi:hypothetical protein